MSKRGFLFTITWSNPYTQPPAGKPRTRAGIYMPLARKNSGAPPVPQELAALHEFGSGYSISVTHLSDPIKTLPPERLAQIRKRKLADRLQKKVPMFAEQFEQAALAARPAYFAGERDPETQAGRDSVLEFEANRLAFWESHAGKLVSFETEVKA